MIIDDDNEDDDDHDDTESFKKLTYHVEFYYKIQFYRCIKNIIK